jgi:hypothetical protein
VLSTPAPAASSPAALTLSTRAATTAAATPNALRLPSPRHPEGFRGLPATLMRTLGLPRDSSPATVAGTPSTPRRVGDARGSFPPRLPLPDGIPHGILGGASAGSTGTALALLAALAALFALAVPRPGRTLRPGSAPWRLSVMHLSLERPG